MGFRLALPTALLYTNEQQQRADDRSVPGRPVIMRRRALNDIRDIFGQEQSIPDERLRGHGDPAEILLFARIPLLDRLPSILCSLAIRLRSRQREVRSNFARQTVR